MSGMCRGCELHKKSEAIVMGDLPGDGVAVAPDVGTPCNRTTLRIEHNNSDTAVVVVVSNNRHIVSSGP